jgi:hypothetical protein
MFIFRLKGLLKSKQKVENICIRLCTVWFMIII